MIPSSFSQMQIESTRDFILLILTLKVRTVKHIVVGSPYVFYKDIAKNLGYDIVTDSDETNLETVITQASELEFLNSNLLLSAVTVGIDGQVKESFFTSAEQHGLLKIDADKMAFWQEHVKLIREKYGKKMSI